MTGQVNFEMMTEFIKFSKYLDFKGQNFDKFIMIYKTWKLSFNLPFFLNINITEKPSPIKLFLSTLKTVNCEKIELTDSFCEEFVCNFNNLSNDCFNSDKIVQCDLSENFYLNSHLVCVYFCHKMKCTKCSNALIEKVITSNLVDQFNIKFVHVDHKSRLMYVFVENELKFDKSLIDYELIRLQNDKIIPFANVYEFFILPKKCVIYESFLNIIWKYRVFLGILDFYVKNVVYMLVSNSERGDYTIYEKILYLLKIDYRIFHFVGDESSLESSLLKLADNGDSKLLITSKESKLSKCNISVTGMSCTSCVGKIESCLKKQTGVHGCTVSLMLQQVNVTFDSELTDEEKLMVIIRSLGDYKCNLLNKGSDSDKFIVKAKAIVSNPKQIQQNEAVKITKSLLKLNGVFDVTNDCYYDGIVFYTSIDTEIIGPRDVLESISKYGHQVVILKQDSSANDLKSAKEIQRKVISIWKRAFLFSLCMGLPLMLLMIFFMIQSKYAKSYNTSVYADYVVFRGLDLENLLFFLLCTPTMYFSGIHYYKNSYSAILHCSMNMDVLVTLATCISYIYSCVVLLIGIFYVNRDGEFSSVTTFFETPPMLFIFISLGRYIENIAKGKSSQALLNLANLNVKNANLVTIDLEADSLRELFCKNIDIDLVHKYDILKILPGERVPLDGSVIQGDSYCDESLITGECLPIHKIKASHVVGGSINQNGVLYISVTHIGQETTLSQIAKIMEFAQTVKAPIENISDRVAAIFIPIVLFLSVLTLIVWLIIGYNRQNSEVNDSFVSRAFMYAISVLSIACPCSLGLAAPTAVMVSTGIGAKNGILIKGGKPLEITSKIDTILFDKTGTITTGKMIVQKFINFMYNSNDVELAFLLYVVGSIELCSEHVIGKSLLYFVKNLICSHDGDLVWIKTKDFVISPGFGLSSKLNISGYSNLKLKCNIPDFSVSEFIEFDYVDGCLLSNFKYANFPALNKFVDINFDETILVGNQKHLIKHSIHIPDLVNSQLHNLEKEAKTAILCCVGGKILCAFGISDTIKPDAKKTISVLKKQFGLNVALVTGDNSHVAMAIAENVGIDQVYAEMLPSQKINKLRQLQAMGHKVAMVGDGINDSPALAAADIGISVFNGSDTAIEASNVTLLNNNLSDIVHVFRLSKVTFRRIKLNFLFASIYNLMGIPIAAGILTPIGIVLKPWMASLAMACSSITVVLSSLHLKKFKKKEITKTSNLISIDNTYKNDIPLKIKLITGNQI
ncbi:hypothetical protein A3Q56_00069 [Intoshia linei]|uniref:P-type Cu(+) transporter n=1 Tax=Intoshia linei TaxID=1819745 RepID=A0A177BCU7_9BILA|nr:hypothetical protein A3Q56_00069 [Intoshia linei]